MASARESTAGLLSDADRLQREAAANRRRGELVHHFLEQYRLSPAEVAALEVTQQALRATQEELKEAEAATAEEVDARLTILQAELQKAKVSVTG